MFFDILIGSQLEECAGNSAGLTAFRQLSLQNELRTNLINLFWAGYGKSRDADVSP
jgi:hypothetical protein